MSTLKRHLGQTRIYISSLMAHALKENKAVIPEVYTEELSRGDMKLLQIFEAMLKLCAKGEPLIPDKVYAELQVLNYSEISLSLLTQMATSVSPSPDFHGPILKLVFKERDLVTFIEEDIPAIGYQDTLSPTQRLNMIASEAMSRASNMHDDSKAMDFDEWHQNWIEYNQRNYERYVIGGKKPVSPPDWWGEISEIVTVEEGQVVVLSGLSGTGKTTGGMNWMMGDLLRGHSVLHILCETNPNIFFNRFAAFTSGYPVKYFARHGFMECPKFVDEKIQKFKAKFKGRLAMKHEPQITPGRILELARQHKQVAEAGDQELVVIIDYVQVTGHSMLAGRGGEREGLSRMVDEIKAIAETEDIRIILLSQLGEGGKTLGSYDIWRRGQAHIILEDSMPDEQIVRLASDGAGNVFHTIPVGEPVYYHYESKAKGLRRYPANKLQEMGVNPNTPGHHIKFEGTKFYPQWLTQAGQKSHLFQLYLDKYNEGEMGHRQKMCFARPQFKMFAYDGDEEVKVDSRRK